MGVLRVKSYHSGKALSNGLNYAQDKEKTKYKDMEIENALSYAADINKTILENADGSVHLVSGHNCQPENAKKCFDLCRDKYLSNGNTETPKKITTKRLFRAKLDEKGEIVRDPSGNRIFDENAPVYYDKETGKAVYEKIETLSKPRLAYMWMMSFPGKKELGYEIPPEKVHEIGIKFCKEFLPDYAATISTHINTEHYHNHIVSCAYDMAGTRKYDDCLNNLNRARKICDELSIEYGLPIILNTSKDKDLSWSEWKSRKEGISWKDDLRRDIKTAVSLSESFSEYKDILNRAGYELRITKNSITYHVPEARFGKKYACRDDKLGEIEDDFAYTKKEIEEYILRKKRKELEPARKRGHLYYGNIQRYTLDERRMLGIEILFVESLKAISYLRNIRKERSVKFVSYDMDINSKMTLGTALKKLSEYEIDSPHKLDELFSKKANEKAGLQEDLYDREISSAYDHKILKIINEIKRCEDELKKEGISSDNLYLHDYAVSEIRDSSALFDPMKPFEKKLLYNELLKNPNFKLTFSFDKLTRKEGRDALRYLQNNSSDKPDILINSYLDRDKKLSLKYENIYKAADKNLKRKSEGRAATAPQVKMIRDLLNGRSVSQDKRTEIESSGIDINNLSFYEAHRIIGYLKDGFKVSNKKEVLERPTANLIKEVSELSKIRGYKGAYDVGSMDMKTMINLRTFLLYKDKRPEFLKSIAEIKRGERDELFEKKLSEVPQKNREMLKRERELLNKLKGMGIERESFNDIRVRSIDNATKSEDLKEELSIISREYKELKQISNLYHSHERFKYHEKRIDYKNRDEKEKIRQNKEILKESREEKKRDGRNADVTRSF